MNLIYVLIVFSIISYVNSFNKLVSVRKTIRTTTTYRNMVTTNNFISEKITKILLQRGSIGQVQGNRSQYHKIGAKRKITDHFIWSHIFLIMGSVVAVTNKSYELFMLLVVTSTLSVLYHYEYEKPSKLAFLEGMSAKILFIYGACQTILKAPSVSIGILLIELLLMFTTLSFFLLTNIYPDSYDRFHCFGLHVIPAIWAVIVAIWHKPFFI